MRISLLLAAALLAAPATAQNTYDNAADPAAAAADPAVTDANAVDPANAVAADPGPMPEPVVAPTMMTPDTATRADRDRGGFPWGAIGIIGLVGLLGRRRSRDAG